MPKKIPLVIGDERGENTLKDEREREVLGAQMELKSRGEFASLVSLIRKNVSQGETGDMTFSIDC